MNRANKILLDNKKVISLEAIDGDTHIFVLPFLNLHGEKRKANKQGIWISLFGLSRNIFWVHEGRVWVSDLKYIHCTRKLEINMLHP